MLNENYFYFTARKLFLDKYMIFVICIFIMKKNCLLIFSFLLALSSIYAQAKHILHGYLLDEQGHPISGVRLQALQSVNIFAESDKNGHFQFSVPDLGTQDLKLSILTNQYTLYNTQTNKNVAIVSAEKQKEGVVNIFMTTSPIAKTRGEQPKSPTETDLNDDGTYISYHDEYQPISRPISLSRSMTQNRDIEPDVRYEPKIVATDSPISPKPTVISMPKTVSPERGASTTEVSKNEVSKNYEVQIAAVSQENATLKPHYEKLTGKEVKIKNKNGRFVYTIPVTSPEEGRELINQLSTSEMEKEGIKHPFMVTLEPGTKPQETVVANPTTKTPASVNKPEASMPAPVPPKVYPVPAAPTPTTTATPTKPQFIIQLQSSRFPMNSVAKRMLEADLGKIGEALYEFNDPNADIKYRYYVMKKFSNVAEAETLRAKLSEIGIQSLILTDKTNVNFK